MKCHIIDNEVKAERSAQELAQFLSRQGQLLLPLVELVEQCRCAVDEVVDVTGRVTIQAILELSAQQVTGGELRQQGKRRPSEVVRWDRQGGRIRLSDRQLKVRKPRLRTKRGEEAPAPAYEAMQDDERLGRRMLEIVLKGVSTRNYEGVLREMAETVGVSKSSVSRETVEAAEQVVKFLYIDGASFRVRINGRVSRQSFCAVLGVSERNECFEALAIEMGDREKTDLWESAFRALLERGLSREAVELGIMDGLPGLQTLFCRYFPRAQTQRCQKHAKANACRRVWKREREAFSKDVSSF